MCLGLGGSSNAASDEARRQEEQRQAEIRAAQQRVSQIFGSPGREAQIQDLINATRSYFQSDLDREHTDTARNLKFALARSGLGGGSVQIDENKKLAETFLRGIIEVERRANAAGSSLRAQDQATKSNLFSQILGGLDTTTAAQEASQALRQNVGLAQSEAFQNSLGDLFGNFGDLFKLSREAAGERRAQYDFNALYGSRPSAATVYGGYGR